MSLLDALIGNASEVDPEHIIEHITPLLIPGEETIIRGFKVLRDMCVFTNYRVIFIEARGLAGKRIEYQSVPYKSITRFSVESAGSFDLETQLKLWLTDQQEPIVKEFRRSADIIGIQKVIAERTIV